jgi:hypothetical protein
VTEIKPESGSLSFDTISKHPQPNQHISIICWSITAILLCFLFLTYLGVLLCFLFGFGISPFIVPVAIIVTLVITDRLGKREGLAGRYRVWPIGIVIVLLILSIFLAGLFYDLSWDGLWYQQTAIYKIAEGWNPIRQPMQELSHHTQIWVRHYSKGPWYIAAAFYRSTGHIELAKCATWLSFGAMFAAVLAACLDFGMNRRRAIALASIVSLNPVVTCQLYSFLVDGLLISFLVCFVAALFGEFRRKNRLALIVTITAAVLCINSKFTGLVYLCFGSTAGLIYCLFKRRDMLIRYVPIQALSILIGVVAFGYNPYVTNYIHRGHIFFPLMGTKEHPSLAQRGRDPIETYETPHNMLRRNRFLRFGYAIFGRPGSQPFMGGNDVKLMWPFAVTKKDMGMNYFHELRISGFGPFFSGIFLIGIVFLCVVLFNPNLPRFVVLLGTAVIAASLLISKQSWWARYGPQLWLLPAVPVAAILWRSKSRLLNRLTWAFVALLLLNALIVAAVHLHWEITSTRKLSHQLSQLSQCNELEVDFQYFDFPFGRRLQNSGISFRHVRRNSLPDGQELMSVCQGYPGVIKFRVKEESSDIELQSPD